MGLTLKEKEAIAGLTAEELKQRSKELRRKWQVDNREKIYEKKRQWVEANRESYNAPVLSEEQGKATGEEQTLP